VTAGGIFNLVPLEDNRVAIHTRDGKFLCVEEGDEAKMTARRNHITPLETFDLIDRGDDKMAFRAHNDLYIRADGGGGGTVTATGRRVGDWETFQTIPV
jgi:hypothetical protein